MISNPPRRLKHDQRRGQLTQLTGQLFQTLAITLGGEGPTGWDDVNTEPILRDIDADKARGGREAFHNPSLRMRARLAVLAIVRVPYGTDGRGTSLFARGFVVGNGKIQGSNRS